VEPIIPEKIQFPPSIQSIMNKTKKSIALEANFGDLKEMLLS